MPTAPLLPATTHTTTHRTRSHTRTHAATTMPPPTHRRACPTTMVVLAALVCCVIDSAAAADYVVDITVPTRAGLPVFMQAGGLPRNWLSRHQLIADGDVCNQATLNLDAHTGTHVDAPLHFVTDGAGIESLDLSVLIGPALVVALPEGTNITADALERLQLPEHATRLLFKTDNSKKRLMYQTAFASNYTAFDSTGAAFVTQRTAIKLVGIDYLSIGCLEDIVETHRILLGKGVIAVEGLDLSGVEPGWYNQVCLPALLAGSDGAPIRCVLAPLSADAPAGDDAGHSEL